MRLRDMLAAAVRPWVGAWAKDGSIGAYVWRTSVSLFANDGGSGIRVHHEGADVFNATIGARRKGDNWRKSYRDSFVVSGLGEVHVESSPTLLGAWVGASEHDRHIVSIRDAQGDPHLFSWGEPMIDFYVGRLGIRYASREDNRIGRAKRDAEHAANDSKAAA